MQSNNLPLISVVMATYNGALYLEQQIQSILEQDYTNLELIIVDDASTDHTVSMLQACAQQDERIKLYVNEKNLGYIQTFEKGLKFATGAFIALSDQDDIWDKQKLSILYQHIVNDPIIYSDSTLINDQGVSLGKNLSDVKRLADVISPLSYAIGGSAPGHAMLIRKNIIDQCLPLPTIFPHDYWIGFIATCNGTMTFLPKSLILYRQHTNNVFGAGKNKKRKKAKPDKKAIQQQKIERLHMMASACPADLPAKNVLSKLANHYTGLSLTRMLIFFEYRDLMLSYKNRSAWQKILFCLKTFFIAP